MNNKQQQRYNLLINRLSLNVIKVITTFIIGPMVLMLFTPMGYFASLGITIITMMIYNQIKRYRNGRR